MEEYKRHPNTQCVVCKKAMYRRPSELARSKDGLFCGRTCYGKSQRKESPCVICKSPILASAHKKTCSRACANKHRTGIIYNRKRKYDKVYEIRALKLRIVEQRGYSCERCQYNRHPILQIHHRDRDRKNNHLSNLELLCPNCHAEEHCLRKRQNSVH